MALLSNPLKKIKRIFTKKVPTAYGEDGEGLPEYSWPNLGNMICPVSLVEIKTDDLQWKCEKCKSPPRDLEQSSEDQVFYSCGDEQYIICPKEGCDEKLFFPIIKHCGRKQDELLGTARNERAHILAVGMDGTEYSGAQAMAGHAFAFLQPKTRMSPYERSTDQLISTSYFLHGRYMANLDQPLKFRFPARRVAFGQGRPFHFYLHGFQPQSQDDFKSQFSFHCAQGMEFDATENPDEIPTRFKTYCKEAKISRMIDNVDILSLCFSAGAVLDFSKRPKIEKMVETLIDEVTLSKETAADGKGTQLVIVLTDHETLFRKLGRDIESAFVAPMNSEIPHEEKREILEGYVRHSTGLDELTKPLLDVFRPYGIHYGCCGPPFIYEREASVVGMRPWAQTFAEEYLYR